MKYWLQAYVASFVGGVSAVHYSTWSPGLSISRSVLLEEGAYSAFGSEELGIHNFSCVALVSREVVLANV